MVDLAKDYIYVYPDEKKQYYLALFIGLVSNRLNAINTILALN